MTKYEAGKFKNGIHFFPVRVYFEDTDAGGIVYHANYLRFAERARTEMLRFGGYNQSLLLRDENNPIAFVVRHCSIDYNGAARLDDLLIIETRVVHVGGARLEMKQAIRREVDGFELVNVNVKLGCLSLSSGKGARIPKMLGKTLLQYMVEERV